MAPHLLTLPGEVKNTIYEYCIDDEVTVEITADKFLNNIRAWHKEWKMIIFEGRPEEKDGDPKEFALAKTCRQIRFEVLPILAEFGHNCLYAQIGGRFTLQMIEPLPQPYLGNMRELRLWKSRPTLKNQTLTSLLPAVDSLILDFHPQHLAKFLGGEGEVRWLHSWSWSYMLSHNVVEKLQERVTATFERESGYLRETEPDREISLQVRIPYGSFSVPVLECKDGPCIESDHTFMFTITTDADDHMCIKIESSAEFIRLEDHIAAGLPYFWEKARFDFI